MGIRTLEKIQALWFCDFRGSLRRHLFMAYWGCHARRSKRATLTWYTRENCLFTLPDCGKIFGPVVCGQPLAHCYRVQMWLQSGQSQEAI